MGKVKARVEDWWWIHQDSVTDTGLLVLALVLKYSAILILMNHVYSLINVPLAQVTVGQAVFGAAMFYFAMVWNPSPKAGKK